MNCKICESTSRVLFRKRVLARYDIDYFQCTACRFVQTEEPYWLDEAYSDAITKTDIGLVQRNEEFTRKTATIILALFPKSKSYLDYGGGYGMLVRMMRDRGFDFYRSDPFCQNLFARGFDANQSAVKTFDLVTAFEVLEHLKDPLEGIGEMLRHGRNLLFSTLLLPKDEELADWWYLGSEHGQHIALFSREALEHVASTFDLRYYTNGASLHLLTQNDFGVRRAAGVLRRPSALTRFLCRRRQKQRRSLLEADYQKARSEITGE